MSEKSECEQCKRVRSDVTFWDCWCMALCDNCEDAFAKAYKMGYRDALRREPK